MVHQQVYPYYAINRSRSLWWAWAKLEDMPVFTILAVDSLGSCAVDPSDWYNWDGSTIIKDRHNETANTLFLNCNVERKVMDDLWNNKHWWNDEIW